MQPVLLATLKSWKAADGDPAVMVFPAPRDPSKGVTPEGCETFYRDVLKLVGKHSPHSWRAAFETIGSDAGEPRDVSKAQLDHAIGDMTETAYDRATRIELRRQLLAWYEVRPIAARDGAEVVALNLARK